MSQYNGFNYEEFYEFVVDFFEADQTPEGKDASAELYTWWNRYVQMFRTNLTVAHSSPGGSSQGLPHLERIIYYPNAAVFFRSPTRTTPSTPSSLALLASVQVVGVFI